MKRDNSWNKLNEMDKKSLQEKMNSYGKGTQSQANKMPVWVGLLYMLVTVIGMVYMIRLQGNYLRNVLLIALVCLLSFCMLYFVFAVGQAICGLISGYKLQEVMIFGLRIRKEKGRLRINAVPKKEVAKTIFGLFLMLPPGAYGEDYPVALYLYGGKIANWIISALAILLSFTVAGQSVSGMVFLLLGLFNIVNIILIKVLGDKNGSGKLIEDIKSSAAVRHSYWVIMHHHSLSCEHVRSKDMPEEWFALPEDDELDNQYCATVLALAFEREVDALRLDEARVLGNIALAHINALPEYLSLAVNIDMLYCELVSENRAEVIEVLFSDSVKECMGRKKSVSSYRNMYTYKLFQNKNEAAAEAQLKLFLNAVDKHPFPFAVENERELVEYARQRFYELLERETLNPTK